MKAPSPTSKPAPTMAPITMPANSPLLRTSGFGPSDADAEGLDTVLLAELAAAIAPAPVVLVVEDAGSDFVDCDAAPAEDCVEDSGVELGVDEGLDVGLGVVVMILLSVEGVAVLGVFVVDGV